MQILDKHLDLIMKATDDQIEITTVLVYCVGVLSRRPNARFLRRVHESNVISSIAKLIKAYKPVERRHLTVDFPDKYMPNGADEKTKERIEFFSRIRLSQAISSLGIIRIEYQPMEWVDMGLMLLLDATTHNVYGVLQANDTKPEMSVSGLTAEAGLDLLTQLLRQVHIVRRMYSLFVPERQLKSIRSVAFALSRLSEMAEIPQFHSLLPLIYKQSDLLVVRTIHHHNHIITCLCGCVYGADVVLSPL
jgi:hypothetical protein